MDQHLISVGHAEADDMGHPMPALEPNDSVILVVDDDPDLLEVASLALQSAGYQVLTAQSGRDALDHLTSSATRIDLVLLDMNLPGMSGIEVIDVMRATGFRTPILMSSGFVDAMERYSSHRDEIAGSLTKPYRLAALIQAASEAIASVQVSLS